MSDAERYEILVIGSGEAGKHLTWNLAQAGHRTAVVERKYIGGSCPNIACLPSKNVIRSAKANWFAKRGKEYGIQTGPVSTDMRGVLARKRKMVEGEVQFHLDRFKATGAELIRGEARFMAPKTVEVQLNDGGRRTITGDRVFLDLGSRAAMPEIPGLAAAKPMTHVARQRDRCPAPGRSELETGRGSFSPAQRPPFSPPAPLQASGQSLGRLLRKRAGSPPLLPPRLLTADRSPPASHPAIGFQPDGQRMRQAGVRASGHQLRHAFASELLRMGTPFSTLQKLLGHTPIRSTQAYTKIDLTQLREVADNDAEAY
jgi:Pyridine nucleotide-disulphide oxidoreductase/Phage integrase family